MKQGVEVLTELSVGYHFSAMFLCFKVSFNEINEHDAV